MSDQFWLIKAQLKRIEPFPDAWTTGVWSAGYKARNHASRQVIMLDEVVIKSCRYMQHDEAQKYINQYIVDITAFVAPMRPFWCNRRQRYKTEQSNVPAPRICCRPTQERHRQHQKVQRPMGSARN